MRSGECEFTTERHDGTAGLGPAVLASPRPLGSRAGRGELTRCKIRYMSRQPLPPIAAAISFIDCINRGDLTGLAELMTDDHSLVVLDEPPLMGREIGRAHV